jgi:hypothetical protein
VPPSADRALRSLVDRVGLSAHSERERAPTPSARVLNQWITERADDPRYFYGRQSAATRSTRAHSAKPSASDQVEASRLGIENLKMILQQSRAGRAATARTSTTCSELYNNDGGPVESLHVARGDERRRRVRGTPDLRSGRRRLQPVPKGRQERAVAFLNEQVFNTPTWMLNEDVMRRFEHAGAMERVRSLQAGVLNSVLSPNRIARLLEAEARNGAESYTANELFADLRSGIWGELSNGRVTDPYRRNLQRAYVDRLQHLMTEDAPDVPARFRAAGGFTPVDVSQSDIRPLVRGELQSLRRDVRTAINRTNDRASRLHLEDIVARIDHILDPRG